MTLYDWTEVEDNYFDFASYSLTDFPEWRNWEQQINNVLDDMDYDDAIGCRFEDLINLAGLEGEIDRAIKQYTMDKRIEKMEGDFE